MFGGVRQGPLGGLTHSGLGTALHTVTVYNRPTIKGIDIYIYIYIYIYPCYVDNPTVAELGAVSQLRSSLNPERVVL